MTTAAAETTTGRAAAIRAEYRKLGWTPRMIGVRSDYYSGGSSIEVTVKSPEVNHARAKQIAKGHERVHTCQVTGETLSGGNRFVSLRFTDECRKSMAAPHLAAVEAACAKVQPDTGRLYPVESAPGFLVGASQYGGFSLWKDAHLCAFNTVSEAAFSIACEIAKAQPFSS